jgi:hypothetical protein
MKYGSQHGFLPSLDCDSAVTRQKERGGPFELSSRKKRSELLRPALLC